MELKKYKLNVIAEILAGGTPSTKKPKYWNGNIPWLSVKDFGNVNKIVSDTEKTITQLGFNNSPSSLLHRGDLIISARGTVGKIAMVDKDMAFNQSCFGLRANKELVTSDFLFYWFANNQQIFKSAQQGNIFKSITLDFFDKTLASIPPLDQQRRIASVLSSLDSKIALNRRINTKLETIAKRLYDYWFVQFDFPDANGNPYKSSGGKMVWNDALKREIPEGWEVKSVDNHCKIFTGKKDVNQSLEQGKYKFFSCAPGYRFSNDKIYDGKAILISGNGSYTGRTIFVNDAFDLYQRTYAVVLKQSNENILEYLFQTMQSFLSPKVNGGTHGSAIPYIVYNDIAKEMFVLPPNKILNAYNAYIIPIFKEIQNSEKETARLTALRDKLLPLLMNGQVEVA